MEKPILSIVTVCYNSQQTIGRTFDSVLAFAKESTEFLIEHIIIDGGSKDRTLEIIKTYSNNIPSNLKLLCKSEQDSGIYDAMNKGINMSSGAYISFLNSDDYLVEGELVKLMSVLMTNAADIYHGDVYWRYDYSGNAPILLRRNGNGSLKELLAGMSLNHPAMFCKRELFDQFGCFDTRYKFVGDWDWTIKVVASGVNLSYQPVAVVNFSMEGVSNQVSYRRTMEIFRVYLGSYKKGYISLARCLSYAFKGFYELLFSSIYQSLLPCKLRSTMHRKRGLKAAEVEG